MKVFNFDENNHLAPYDVIPCTEDEFRDFFIYKLDPKLSKRYRRWVEYCEFISFIKKHGITKPFKVWIFGSLVGNYKEPSDIDIALFFAEEDLVNVQQSGFDTYLKKNSALVFNIQCENIFANPKNEEEKAELMSAVRKLMFTRNDKPKGLVEIIY
jgi:predicted nucleotidyltransferase